MVDFYPYTNKFKTLFEKERGKIKKVLPKAEIFHVGSTAVENVGGKGIIDILVVLKNWNDKKRAVESLKKLGFTHIHPEKNKRIFLSRKGETGYGDTHIHLTKKGSGEHKEKIAFRDFLRKNPEKARKYHKIKKKAMKQAKKDRYLYNEIKKDFIKKILEKKS